MKQLITSLLTLVLIFSCWMTAFAAESDTLDRGKNQTDIGVYANTEYNVDCVIFDRRAIGGHFLPLKGGTGVISGLGPDWQICDFYNCQIAIMQKMW